MILQTPKDVFLQQKSLYGYAALFYASNFEKCRQNNESSIILEAVLHWINTQHPSEEEIGTMLEETWSMVQHLQDKPDIQSQFLTMMAANGLTNQKIKRRYAFLYDRIKRNAGETQRYGTQVIYTPTGCSTGGLEDEDNIEKLREDMGLETIQEYYANFPGCNRTTSYE